MEFRSNICHDLDLRKFVRKFVQHFILHEISLAFRESSLNDRNAICWGKKQWRSVLETSFQFIIFARECLNE